MPRLLHHLHPVLRRAAALALAGLACTILLASGPVHAADAADAQAQPRPRIGLALGGGGARGLAHIGVLKVLEELKVPVDYIAGTSSGAIIGGMYASGLSPREIEDRIVAIDWDDILSDKLARRDLSYRRKQDDRDYLFPMEIGVRDFRLIFPRGLIAGQKVGFFLRSSTLGVAGINDFDRLPIPYRAVATDLETGAAVALGEGDLAVAMQASMAIPGIFSPVEIGERLLADGGMSANVPVEVVRAMGADIIIAVNISSPLLAREKIESVVDVSDQALSFLSQKTNQQQLVQLRGDDILITPELGDVGAAQFERAPEIIAAGVYAAGIQEALLRQLGVPERTFEAFLHRQRAEEQPRVRLDAIVVDQPARVDKRVISRRLDTKAGEELNLETLRGDMARIYDLGDFERVDFRVVHSGERNELHVDVEEKSWGPDYLRFGLNLIDDFEGDSRFNILANYTRTWINTFGGEWKNEFSIGHTRKIFTELYQPLDPYSVWFVAPHAQYVQDTFDVYSGDYRVAEYNRKRTEAGVDTGLQLGKHGEVRVGAVRELVDSVPRIGAEDLPSYDIRQGAWVASVVYDRIDDVSFPRRGFLADSHLYAARSYLGADAEYEKLDLSWLTAFTYQTHTMYAGFELGTNLDNTLPLYDTFTLGGFQRLSGYRNDQLSGQHLLFGRLVYYERVGRLPKAAGNGFYLGASLEAGNVWDEEDLEEFIELRTAYSLFAGAETLLGPLYLAYGQSDGGNYAFYLILGRTF